jgi:hypothetical protein
MTVASLFARIGLKTDEEKAKSFTRSMNVAKTTLIGVAGVATGTALAIRKITNDAMNAAVAFKQFEVETGSSAQELQKWQAVAEQTNQSAESVTSAIKAITSNQEKIRLGQGDISGYQLLGIDPRQDPFKILEELREKTEGMTQGMKRNILAQMGIGAGMIQTLELSRDAFDDMASRAFIISPQAIETLNRSKAMMDQAARGVQYLKAQIAVGLSPQIEKTTKAIIKFIKANEDGFIEGFKKAYSILSKFLGALGNAGRVINSMITATIGWNNAFKILIGTIALLNASLLLSPIGLITAGIILLIAVIDDLYVYSKGGKSLFGEMMKNFPALEGNLKNLFDKFEIFRDVIKGLWSGDAGSIQGILDEWGAWGDILENIVTWLRDIKDLISQTKIGREEGETTASRRTEQYQATQEQGLGLLFRDPAAWASNVKSVLSGHGSNINNNVQIDISGAQSPSETASEVKRELQRALNSTSAQRSRNE